MEKTSPAAQPLSRTSRRTLRRAAERAQWLVVKKGFTFWQSLGVHVTPNHFYGPVPDTRTLPPSMWSKTSELVGIDLRVGEQLELIEDFRTNLSAEYEALPRTPSDDAT
jgi:hypothetical protein